MLITLRELCNQVDVSRRSIQCYEVEGLMHPTEKNKYGHLLYDEVAVKRAEEIHFFHRLGFKLREIKEIIDAPEHEKKAAIMSRLKDIESQRESLEQLIIEAQNVIK